MLSISAAYLVVEFTLAMLGWRGFLSFFSHPQFLALAILTVVLTAASFFSGASISTGVKEDRSNRWVIGALSLIGLLLAFFSAYTDRLGLLVFGGNTLRWAGVVLFTVGGVLRLWPVFVLGRRFSGLVAIQENHTLVTDGIYRFVRNPSYVGLLLTSLGWGLGFRSIIGVVLAAILLIPTIARIDSEEALLARAFGDEYDAYRKRSWRLL